MKQKLQNFLNSGDYIEFKEVHWHHKSFYNKERKRHRLDGPAYEGAGGYKRWYIDGKLHRLDGPAQEYSDGSKNWYVNGKRHRLDGPAYEDVDGSKCWWVNGERHRLDGPAYKHSNGTKAWYVDNKKIKEENYPRAVEEYLLNPEA